MDRAEVYFASIVLAVVTLSIAVFMVLIFYMPKWVAHWASLDVALPLWKAWLARFSIAAQEHHRVLWVVLGLGFVASASWWVVAKARCAESRATLPD